MVSMKNAYRESLQAKVLSAWEASAQGPISCVVALEHMKRVEGLFQKLELCYEPAIGAGELKWIAFAGFGHKLLRDAFCLTVRHFMKPKLIHSAMTDTFRWEGLMCVRVRGENEFGSICEDFAASISLIEIESFMDAPMQACLARLEQGSNYMGNYFTKKCAFFRSQYAAVKEQQREQRKREEEQQVRVLTGIEFTPRNMISLYEEYQSSVQYWRHQHNANLHESRDHLEHVYSELSMQTERLRLLLRDVAREQPYSHTANTVGGPWAASHLNGVAQSRLSSIIDGLGAIMGSRSRFFASTATA